MTTPLVFNCHLICYDDFGPDELCVSIKCGHVMHSKCMNEWISKQNTCPYCSVSTTLNDIVKVQYDDTINDFFSGYYKGKYEEICKQIEEGKVNTRRYSPTGQDTMGKLELDVIRQKNKRLTDQLYHKIVSGSNFISQRGLEDMIHMETASKNEKINSLKFMLSQETEKNNPNIKGILYQAKVYELEDKIKFQKEEKNKCLQKVAHLQLQYNKLASENKILREKYLTLDVCQELKNKIKNQTEIINDLTRKNEALKKQKQNHKNIVDKINEKADQKYRDLYIKYQDLKLHSESMENQSELFEKKEREFYAFHRNIISLATKISLSDNKTEELLRLFIKEKTNSNSDLWKKTSDSIFTMYKKLTGLVEMDMLMHQSAAKQHTELPKESGKNQ
uniref:RING-type domain-containing protein n=1 Tax=Strongyloides papillosus TaxID=174720 RepID=A0A0N5BPQ8_STREA